MPLKLGLRLNQDTVIDQDGQEVTDLTGYNLINDLPGFSVKVLAKTASSDLMTATDNFKKLCRIAFSVVKNNFFASLGRYLTINSVYDITTKKLSGIATTGEGYIAFNKRCLDVFVKFKIHKLVVKFNTETTIVVTVLDGVKTTNYSFDVVPGFNELTLDYTFQSNNGRVSFTSDDWETGTDYNYYSSYYSCLSDCDNYETTYNIGFVSYCVVDKDSIMEMFIDDLNYCAFWQFGIRACEEFLNSERVNWLVDMKKEQAETNIAYWNKSYDSVSQTAGEYPSSLYRVVQNAKLQLRLGDVATPTGSQIINFHP